MAGAVSCVGKAPLVKFGLYKQRMSQQSKGVNNKESNRLSTR